METFKVELNIFFCIMICLQTYGGQGAEGSVLNKNDPLSLNILLLSHEAVAVFKKD